jgi:hypothetical protein
MKLILSILALSSLCLSEPTENYGFKIDSLSDVIRVLQYGRSKATDPILNQDSISIPAIISELEEYERLNKVKNNHSNQLKEVNRKQLPNQSIDKFNIYESKIDSITKILSNIDLNATLDPIDLMNEIKRLQIAQKSYNTKVKPYNGSVVRAGKKIKSSVTLSIIGVLLGAVAVPVAQKSYKASIGIGIGGIIFNIIAIGQLWSAGNELENTTGIGRIN